MAHCNFKIPFPESSEELLIIAHKSIAEHKGIFEGDTKSGHFSIPIGIGHIEGNYTIANSEISIDVTKKPMLVSCKMIEKRLTEYLEPPRD